jgi:hypothetical protein
MEDSLAQVQVLLDGFVAWLIGGSHRNPKMALFSFEENEEEFLLMFFLLDESIRRMCKLRRSSK